MKNQPALVATSTGWASGRLGLALHARRVQQHALDDVAIIRCGFERLGELERGRGGGVLHLAVSFRVEDGGDGQRLDGDHLERTGAVPELDADAIASGESRGLCNAVAN